MSAPSLRTCAFMTIKSSSDFQRIAHRGKKWVGSAFIMQGLGTEQGAPCRFGLTVSRRVGNAVMRNRAKRRLREIIRTSPVLPRINGIDIVLIAKTAAVDFDFQRMKEDFLKGLTNVGALT